MNEEHPDYSNQLFSSPLRFFHSRLSSFPSFPALLPLAASISPHCCASTRTELLRLNPFSGCYSYGDANLRSSHRSLRGARERSASSAIRQHAGLVSVQYPFPLPLPLPYYHSISGRGGGTGGVAEYFMCITRQTQDKMRERIKRGRLKQQKTRRQEHSYEILFTSEDTTCASVCLSACLSPPVISLLPFSLCL